MPNHKESTKENIDLQNITRKKHNLSPGLEPKTTKHTVKKPRTNNSFEINKCRHETKKALTSNIANKYNQREGPLKVVMRTPEPKIYTLTRRSATKYGACGSRGDESNERRGNDVGWRKQRDGKAIREMKKMDCFETSEQTLWRI